MPIYILNSHVHRISALRQAFAMSLTRRSYRPATLASGRLRHRDWLMWHRGLAIMA